MNHSVTEPFRRSMPATVCRHCSRLLQCHVYYLNVDHSIRCTYACGQTSHSEDSDLLLALFCGEAVREQPVIKSIRPGEMYIAVDLFDHGQFYGRMVAGPIMGVSKTAHETGDSTGQRMENFDHAVSAAVLLYYFVYGEWLDEKDVLELCRKGRPPSDETEPESRSTSARQPESAFHHSIAYENHLYCLITEGNEKKLLEMIQTPPDGTYGLLDKKHPLRNIKNDCICIITLATRAAIAGGLDFETAFSMSDEAIQTLELHDSIDSIFQLMEQTLCRFAQKVANTRHLNYSYRINRCRNYVINHIYEKLTVWEIAAYLYLSPEYLSGQFKKETGIRLIDFIQMARAEEAKKLLLHTNKSILEIASLLNYHDQSHFTKSFKHVFGITPGGCRKALGASEPFKKKT